MSCLLFFFLLRLRRRIACPQCPPSAFPVWPAAPARPPLADGRASSLAVTAAFQPRRLHPSADEYHPSHGIGRWRVPAARIWAMAVVTGFPSLSLSPLLRRPALFSSCLCASCRPRGLMSRSPRSWIPVRPFSWPPVFIRGWLPSSASFATNTLVSFLLVASRDPEHLPNRSSPRAGRISSFSLLLPSPMASASVLWPGAALSLHAPLSTAAPRFPY